MPIVTNGMYDKLFILMPPGNWAMTSSCEVLQSLLWRLKMQHSGEKQFAGDHKDLVIIIPEACKFGGKNVDEMRSFASELNAGLPGAQKVNFIETDPTKLNGMLWVSGKRDAGMIVTQTPVLGFDFGRTSACEKLMATYADKEADLVIKSTQDDMVVHQSYSQVKPIMQIVYNSQGFDPQRVSKLANGNMRSTITFTLNSATLCVSLEMIRRPVLFRKPQSGYAFEFYV